MDCSEKFVSDIIKVYPIPSGRIIYQVPVNVRTTDIAIAQMQLEEGQTLTMSALKTFLASQVVFTTTNENDAYDIPTEEGISVSEKSERDVSGYQKSISMQFTIHYYNDSLSFLRVEHETVEKMERAGHDFILERLDGSLSLARYFSPAQKVTHSINESDGEHRCTVNIEMKNVTGIQNIIESTT